MIPTQHIQELSIWNLPARVSQIKQSEKIFGSQSECRTKWSCFDRLSRTKQGVVEIWWGHRVKDARWACDEWKSGCRTGFADCTATQISGNC